MSIHEPPSLRILVVADTDLTSAASKDSRSGWPNLSKSRIAPTQTQTRDTRQKLCRIDPPINLCCTVLCAMEILSSLPQVYTGTTCLFYLAKQKATLIPNEHYNGVRWLEKDWFVYSCLFSFYRL